VVGKKRKPGRRSRTGGEGPKRGESAGRDQWGELGGKAVGKPTEERGDTRRRLGGKKKKLSKKKGRGKRGRKTSGDTPQGTFNLHEKPKKDPQAKGKRKNSQKSKRGKS